MTFKRIALSIAVLIGGFSPSMAQNVGAYSLAPLPTVQSLDERLKTVEYWVEREKRLDAQAEKLRIECENARGNNWRRGPDADPCK
jgi:hypothetical protein